LKGAEKKENWPETLRFKHRQRPVKDCQVDDFRACGMRAVASRAFKQKAAVSDSGYKA
jgi:hypothetical protein